MENKDYDLTKVGVVEEEVMVQISGERYRLLAIKESDATYWAIIWNDRTREYKEVYCYSLTHWKDPKVIPMTNTEALHDNSR